MPDPHRLFFFPACLACGLAAFAFWRWQGAPVPLPEVPGGRLQCLSYTTFEPGQVGAAAPGWVSAARIDDDLRRLAPYTDCLRVYTPLGNTPRVVEAASRQGFHILLGAWIGSDLEQNEKEIRAALSLARRYPGTVNAIVVGNEVLLRREMPEAELAALITAVKAQSPVPVAYADVAHYISESPPVAAAADLLLIHLLPYWDDPTPPPVAEAVTQVLQGFGEFRARFPGKPVMIGETGWPSAGRMRGPARPGVINQARFIREFALRAGRSGVRYNLIEAIDQPWKRPPEGTVGGYWGILDEYRQPKFGLQGPVTEWPGWRRYWLATSALCLVMLTAGLRSRWSSVAWLGWACISLATALALVFQWRHAIVTSQSAFGWLGTGAAAALTGAAVAQLGATLAGVARAAPAPLVELGRALDRPGEILRSGQLRCAAFVALVMLPAAWLSITLAFAPRYRDIPVAQFALPALAMCILWLGVPHRNNDRREEATLAVIILICAVAQLEWANWESAAWLLIATLIAAPWIGSLSREFTRVRRLLANPGKAQQGGENA